jgi:hypothetical protein
MSTYDSTGISMDRYVDILADLVALAKANWGESVSTDEEELLGHLFAQISYRIDTVNEKVQEIYDALGISNNSGVPLGNVLELIGMAFQSETPSTATVTCTVTKATTILAGSIVKTATNVYFTTDEALVFVGAGSDDVAVTCTVNGPNAAAIGEINTIVSSAPGWTTVTNAAAAVPGRLQESDAEIKVRHTAAVATSGERDSASITEAVGNVSGVSAVLVDDDSYPVAIYVIGGTDALVAAAIDGQLTVGIETAGTTSVDVYSSTTKQDKTISFTRAVDLDIYIDLEIEVTSTFPSDGDTQIKTAIEALFDGIGIDDDVIYLKIPGAAFSVPGMNVSAAYVGTAPSPSGTSDISVSKTQRAVIDTANITITHV